MNEITIKGAAVQEIEDRLLKIWDDAERFKTRIEKEPQNKLEERVLSIPGLEVFRDPRDKKIFYEMDGRHFDRPEEVIRALIRYRSAGRKKAMTQTKIEIYKHIHAHLKKMALEDLNAEKSREVKRGGNMIGFVVIFTLAAFVAVLIIASAMIAKWTAQVVKEAAKKKEEEER